MRKRLLLLIFCVLLVLPSGQISAKEKAKTEDTDSVITIQTIDLKIFSNYLNINSNGKATVNVFAKGVTADKVIINTYLKRYTGSSWETVKMWSVSENGNYAEISKSYYVASGYQYKVFSYCYLYSNGSLIESSSGSSDSIVY
ncbi:MAG: hypothetical protein CVV02_07405 [Firmicutes bacterium HGW-Firmicutes-7]|nr:MAG: hypothetical protein CVV02_07405 [Firmicutes bacterium HGW-Firmicutes-7]